MSHSLSLLVGLAKDRTVGATQHLLVGGTTRDRSCSRGRFCCVSILERLRAEVFDGKGPYMFSDLAAAMRLSPGDGDRYFLLRAAPVSETPEEHGGATVTLWEVTGLHRLDESQNDLVATVAHELRTPLTSLRMVLQLCLEQALGPLTRKQ